MHDLTFNKVAAAVLATALGFMLIKEVSHMAMHVSKPDVPAYALELPEQGGPGEVVEDLPFPQPDWIAAMDVERGAKVFKKCTSCHNSEDGGANGTGPNLWNIVGQASAQKAGFAYSGALANSGIVWNYEELDGFLAKPTKYLSGTNMNFVGLKKPNDRAAVIEYLRVAAPSPVDRPEAAVVDTIDVVEEIAEDGADVVENVVEDAGNIVEDVVEGAENLAEDVVEGAENLAEDAGEALQDAGEAIADTTETVIEKAGELVDEAEDAVTGDEE